MRLWRGYELADWGGARPTWRQVGPRFRRGKPATLRTASRRITNRVAKREIYRHGEIAFY